MIMTTPTQNQPIHDTAIRAAAGRTELAIAQYHAGAKGDDMVRAFVELVTALLPRAGREAVAAIVNLCALEIARERVEAKRDTARVVAIR